MFQVKGMLFLFSFLLHICSDNLNDNRWSNNRVVESHHREALLFAESRLPLTSNIYESILVPRSAIGRLTSATSPRWRRFLASERVNGAHLPPESFRCDVTVRGSGDTLYTPELRDTRALIHRMNQ